MVEIPSFANVEAKPGSQKPDPILIAHGVMRSFGGLVAVNVDHFEAQRHSITALIGNASSRSRRVASVSPSSSSMA